MFVATFMVDRWKYKFQAGDKDVGNTAFERVWGPPSIQLNVAGDLCIRERDRDRCTWFSFLLKLI